MLVTLQPIRGATVGSMDKQAERAGFTRIAHGVRVLAAFSVLSLAACSSGPGDNSTKKETEAVSAKVAMDIAERSRATGDLASAISFYRRALQLEPNLTPALLRLGDALLDSGAPNEAAESFRKVLAQSPNNADALSGLGTALVGLDQPVAAINLLRKGLPAAPSPRGYRAIGVAEDMLGQYPAAAADYQKGLALAPGDLGLRSDLGLSQALSGDFDAAVATMRIAASGTSATARHRQNLALVLGLAGRMDEAWKVGLLDLDEKSVRNNIAYYAELRALPADARAQAILRPSAQLPPRPASSTGAQPTSTH